MRTRAKSFLAVVLAVAPVSLLAQKPPLGDEFQANTFTTDFQGAPSAASGGHGTFVVVWTSAVQDSGSYGIFGQRFSAFGSKLGAEFPINTYTTDRQQSASVAMAGAGQFVVVWQSRGQDGDSSPGIFGQRFDSSGSKAGGEFHVNTYTTGYQSNPVVAVDGAGDFVVVWKGDDIFAQRFNNAGVKIGGEFRVNTYTTGEQLFPSVAMTAAGDFVVVWSSAGDGSSFGVFGQRFGRTGVAVGSEFLVNTYTTDNQVVPRVAIGERGNFVVVWVSAGQDGSSNGVFGQRFNSGSERVGSEFQVNVFTNGYQDQPSIAMEGNGFTVAWHSEVGANSYEIFAQRFDRNGNRIGSETDLQINTTTANQQLFPVVVNTGLGFTAVWESDVQDGSAFGVFGRRQTFSPAGVAVDARGIGTSDLNGVLEPGEAVLVDPEWSNVTTSFDLLDGNASIFSGPAGPIYTLLDSSASYGVLGPSVAATCNDGAPGACYAVQLSGTRPAPHWDATLQENMSVGGSHFWKLHVGDSFSDVSRSQPFYKKIETLLHHGITSGCDATQYCPGNPVPRDQMAIFVAKGIAGSGELVPSAGKVVAAAYNCSPGGHSLFSDVSPTDSFCKHVHYLAAQNVTLGCTATQYCPTLTITRDAMASFIAKAIVAPQGGPGVPVVYADSGTGRSYSCNPGSPNLHFTDVPVSNAFCKHIHYLWARGFVDGCSATQYCPGNPVDRDAMAKFIANGFGLQLYGP